MNRRGFLGAGLGSIVAATAAGQHAAGAASGASEPISQPGTGKATPPADVRLHVKPVMTNIIHSGVWEGPCRWHSVCVETETEQAEKRFAGWSKQLNERGLGRPGDVSVLEPAHVRFSEDFLLKPDQLAPLEADAHDTDAYFVYPAGSSIAAFEIGHRFNKPIILVGLGCRNVDIAAYTRNIGNEAFVAANTEELAELLSLLRARKVFRQTRVLFPTDRGLPAVCSVGSIWDLDALQQRHGIAVRQIPYRELAAEMERTMNDEPQTRRAEGIADQLLRGADKSYIDRKYVVRSGQFYQTVRSLMGRHGCNAFTIECFELCSSKLADQWKITPCLIHSLLREQECAASCEADLGSLLAMRMLMSVSRKSCHQGNSDPRGEGTFRINHSLPSRKMNGYDQPDLPYQLGRFVTSGWGTKVVVDFMNNDEKTVTVARVDPSAARLLVLRGELVGASGWDQDLIGCSVEALIKPPEGRADEFLKKRLDYGNHLQWVYGDCTDRMRQLGEILGLEVEVIS
jgi:hypothetical protein